MLGRRVYRIASTSLRSWETRSSQLQAQRHYSFWNRVTETLWGKSTDQPTTTQKPDDPQALLKALQDNKPSWLIPGLRDHHRIQKKTTQSVIDRENFAGLLRQATLNLNTWSQKHESSPHQIEVVRGDWGDIAQQKTKKHGQIYGVLNMANAYFFGGDFLGGGSAQEENMFARTSCSNHIFEEGSKMYIDESGVYRYKEEMSQLISAQTLMTPEELNRLSVILGRRIEKAFKVHMDTSEPEVCFRGPELFYNNPSIDDGRSSGRVALGESEGSFALLRSADIFPFHEIRSAALDLTDSDIKVDWKNPTFLAWYRKETKQRIDAQLDTALINGIRHLVLCAFGCGAFRNPAHEVASIYRESIQERAPHFEHIVFAIYHAGYGPDNFPAFERELNGLALGIEVEKSLTASRVNLKK